jgi:hypothetical protein
MSLSKVEESEYAALLSEGVIESPIKHKRKGVTATIDFIIPGFGHLFYLGEQSGASLFLSNILWPFSAFWGAYAGVVDTDVVNRRHTIEYYLYGEGKQELDRTRMERTFEQALRFVEIQQQSGRQEVARGEVTAALTIAGAKPEHIHDLDWSSLEARSGVRITAEISAPPPQGPAQVEAQPD